MSKITVTIPAVDGLGTKTYEMEEGSVFVLNYVAEMLSRGMSPRVVNVTPDIVQGELESLRDIGDITDEDNIPEHFDTEMAWEIAKDADTEIENDHHFLDGVNDDMYEAAREAILRHLEINEAA